MVSKTHVEVKGTNYEKFSMKHRGTILLNSLPNDLDNVKSYSTQKFIKTLYIFRYLLLYLVVTVEGYM